MSDFVSLYVMGISVSQLKSGAYALILAEENGPRRIPLVIGEAEAKSIVLVMEGIHTPRPVTHDLFVTFAHAFGVRMTKVFIYKFEDGIFYSQITFNDGNREVVMDARTSDAVAIALRTETPIVTTEDILRRAGFVISDDMLKPSAEAEDDAKDAAPSAPSSYHATPKLENYTIEELERTLAELIDREEYEQADKVSKLIEQKRNNQRS